MQKNAPYADTPIPLSLRSLTGLRYRTLNCMECGHAFIERSSTQIFRFSNDSPEVAHVAADGLIHSTCPGCTQKYTLTVAVDMDSGRSDLPLYLQPQSIFVISEPVKKLRDVFCLECGKAFYSISDRIKLLVDNVTPIEMLDADRLGPMEARCKFQHCKQRFYVRV
jgi:hypothetical protein